MQQSKCFEALETDIWSGFNVVVDVVIQSILAAETAPNRRGQPRNDLKILEIDLGGRNRSDFGTVRPQVQIAGPRPKI
jgi:hypothetical protein